MKITIDLETITALVNRYKDVSSCSQSEKEYIDKVVGNLALLCNKQKSKVVRLDFRKKRE